MVFFFAVWAGGRVVFVVWAGGVFFLPFGPGACFFLCCLLGGRVLFFAVWVGGVFFCCLGGGVFFLFAVWAGDGSSLTYRSAWLVFKRPNNKKNKQQTKIKKNTGSLLNPKP